MYKKYLLIVLGAIVMSMTAANAQMTDQAIITYITQGLAAGKTQSQIGAELMAKGVTASQAKRLMQTYKNSQVGDLTTTGTNLLDETTSVATKGRKRSGSKNTAGNAMDRDSLLNKQTTILDQTDEDKKAKKELEEKGQKVIEIYGHDLFKNPRLSFEPNDNMATPANYVIGPGDELIIDVWGLNEATLKEQVSPEGRIILAQVGPVNVGGLTIEQATKKIRTALSAKFSLGGSNPESKMSVTLGNVRSIQVNVLGEVKTPGTYRLSSLTTLFNALYRAGGVTSIGSLRNVQVFRGGKLVCAADIYRFLFDGSTEGNIALRDGDVVIVPSYQYLVEVKGGVKRPMYYESLPGESVGSILTYAGGFSSSAFHDAVSIERVDGTSGKVYTIKSDEFGNFSLMDGDIITVYTNKQKNLFDNRVEIKGTVLRPGVYALGNDIATVKQLVDHAGGLLENSFRLRAQILRENDDRSLSIQAVPIGAIMDGTAPDVLLRKNDVLMVANTNEIDVKGNLTISGFVMEPGEYEFADNMSIEDLILIAGGLESGASSVRVDVARRINIANSSEASDTLAQVFSFGIKDGLMVDGDPSFTLQPYDVVAVRKSPTYVEQKRVRISGEVTFAGEYTLVSNAERLSDLFKRAGGATPNGYIEGAMLRRKVSEDERNVRRNMVNIVKRGGANKTDSLKMEKLKINETYTIGINLDQAIANPGSMYDVVLHDGDELIIPSLTNTVRVQGEVLYPNSVGFIPGKTVGYYVRQAGGFSNDARRAKVYVVHMNGKVSSGLGSKVDAGSEIIVPSRPERQKMTAGEWIGIGTSAASITTMIATIVNVIRQK